MLVDQGHRVTVKVA